MNGLWHLGWIITFLFIPLGSSLPGLLFILPPLLVYSIRDSNQIKQMLFGENLSGWTNKLFLSFLFITLVSSLLSSRPIFALEVLFGFLILFYVFYFGAQRLAEEIDTFVANKCLLFCVIGSTLACITAIIRYFLDINNKYFSGRAVNLFSDCNGFAIIIIMCCGISLSFFLQYETRIKYLAIPYLLLLMVAILLTKSRGGWLGFSVMLGTFTLLNRRFIPAIIVITIILSLIFSLNPILKMRLFSLLSLESNIDRLNIWEATIKMIRDHPVIGIGAGLFPLIYKDYVEDDFVALEASFSHNIFLEIMVEFGIFGLAFFCLMLFTILKMSFSLAKIDRIYQGFFASLIGVLVHLQFDLPIWGFGIGGAFWMLMGLTVGIYRMKRKEISSGCGQSHLLKYNS